MLMLGTALQARTQPFRPRGGGGGGGGGTYNAEGALFSSEKRKNVFECVIKIRDIYTHYIANW